MNARPFLTGPGYRGPAVLVKLFRAGCVNPGAFRLKAALVGITINRLE